MAKQPEENNKNQEMSNDQAKVSARDERAAKGEQRTNRSESEHAPKFERVGDTDKDGVYKSTSRGAVSQEAMRTNAAVQEENDQARQEAKDQKLDTTPQAAKKLLEEGAKNKTEFGNHRPNEVGQELADTLENDMPMRRIVDQANQAEMHGATAGSPTMEYTFTTKLVKRAPSEDVKKFSMDGLSGMYDEWEKTLSSSEREAFAYNPDAGMISFRKFMNRYDEMTFRAKLMDNATKSK